MIYDYLQIQELTRLSKQLLNKPFYPKWLSIIKASEYCSLSPTTLNRLINKGQLKASKVTGNSLIKVDWLDKYLEGK